MTLTAARSVPARRDPAPGDGRIAGLLADLHALGLHGRKLTDGVVGEPDVRVQVWLGGSPVSVELLWTDRDDCPPEHLDAVRICDDERTVWRSTRLHWTDADAVRFLSDLLLLAPAVLNRRHLLVG